MEFKFVWNSQDEEYVSDISDNTQDGVLDIRNDWYQQKSGLQKKMQGHLNLFQIQLLAFIQKTIFMIRW